VKPGIRSINLQSDSAYPSKGEGKGTIQLTMRFLEGEEVYRIMHQTKVGGEEMTVALCKVKLI